jgi:hypothetical protein
MQSPIVSRPRANPLVIRMLPAPSMILAQMPAKWLPATMAHRWFNSGISV